MAEKRAAKMDIDDFLKYFFFFFFLFAINKTKNNNNKNKNKKHRLLAGFNEVGIHFS